MKLLKTFEDKDIFPSVKAINHADFRERLAARAVLFDQDKNIALLHVTKYNYHKLPGGGVEEGESNEQGLSRELLEETGCKTEIKEEIGEIIEYRDKYKIKNDSFCWIAEVIGEKEALNFMEDEVEEGFELEWTSLSEAIRKIGNDDPGDYQGFFIKQRDLLFLKEAEKLIKEKNGERS